ncbi:arylsulfatase [Planctomyces sp. SH-PL14]|uniref:arylsulfatase n=1 Tax=Planctomyces sp. SH-PL14 TaxID=1632864 RepID=UPI00078DBDFA|nr:arylsulfatase [Planctomyces sp. SH-PL14]AMV19738.1 Arylsulfatase [Planctomyces sp. SH-PL14]
MRSLLLLTLCFLWPSLLLAAPRPNIILIITDDQGYGDLACHGNPHVHTPNIDRLASESVRLTNFHVSPTCAPTRCALMTGRHEFRSGVTHTINERERMSLKATPYPQLLQKAGYRAGIFGKWHLGDQPEYQPGKRGFDEVFIHGAGGIGQTYPGSCGDAPGNSYFSPAILHNGTFEKTKGYCTDVFFSEALNWIDRQRSQGPFYCHIATNAPHGPLDCPEEYQKRYPDLAPDLAKFYGMITNIDDNVGRLMAKLTEWKMDENTLVIFMTDNGGTVGVKDFNAGMRGQKVTPWEGGIRVPSFWRWKGTWGPKEVPELTAHLDYFRTFCDLAGASIPEDVAGRLDGRSLIPLLSQPKADWPDRTLVAHMGRWERGKVEEAKYANCSIRNARYSLVSVPAKPRQPATTPMWQLFDLQADPGQKTNIAESEPKVVESLSGAYDAWWTSILPELSNEDAPVTGTNTFHDLYWKQFPDERPRDAK